MRHSVTPTVNVYYLRGDKVLLIRRANTGYMDGFLCPPGGHIEKGETPMIAMAREIKEELGIEVYPEDLSFLCVAARNSEGKEIVAYQFLLMGNEYEPINAEPHKCTELVWHSVNNLPKDLIPDFRQVIDQSIKSDNNYLEIGY